jgi:hypothetical protein
VLGIVRLEGAGAFQVERGGQAFDRAQPEVLLTALKATQVSAMYAQAFGEGLLAGKWRSSTGVCSPVTRTGR